MKKLYEKLENKFDSFSIREKMLTCSAFLMVIYFCWSTVLFDYILATQADIDKRAQEIRDKINLLEGKVDNISQVLGRDPTSALIAQANALKLECNTLSLQVKEKAKKMMPSREMTKILSNIIQQLTELKINGVTLNHIQSDGTKPLGTAKTIEMDNAKQSFQIFQHAIGVEMSAGYFDTLKFLQAVEKFHPDLVWDELEYEVKNFPYGSVKLKLHTLSLEQGWIGV